MVLQELLSLIYQRVEGSDWKFQGGNCQVLDDIFHYDCVRVWGKVQSPKSLVPLLETEKNIVGVVVERLDCSLV